MQAYLAVSSDQTPLDLDRRDLMHSMGATQLVGGAVGEANMPDLALVNQRLRHSQNFNQCVNMHCRAPLHDNWE